MGQRGGVSLAQEQKPKNIGHRVPFFPFEVDVRDATGELLDVNQQRRNRIRHDGAARSQNAMVVQSFPAHRELLSKFGRIGQFHLDKDDLGMFREPMHAPHECVNLFVTTVLWAVSITDDHQDDQ
jgi:hypothetical protein